jgi:hypothetical protein
MAPRVSVLVKPIDGGKHQAICTTRDCTAGPDGGPWESTGHVVKAAAEEDARNHRDWHRSQQAIPAEAGE